MATSPSGWRMPALGRLFVRVLLRLVGARDVLADRARRGDEAGVRAAPGKPLTVPHARFARMRRPRRPTPFVSYVRGWKVTNVTGTVTLRRKGKTMARGGTEHGLADVRSGENHNMRRPEHRRSTTYCG